MKVAANQRTEEERVVTVSTIEAGKTEQRYWRDLWDYRDLFYFLSWRDILVRYKQTVIGIAWAVLRPVITMAVFAFVFGRLAKMPSEGLPYPVFVYAAMLPWQFFATALSEASNSLLSNSNLISKIYFPRLIVPASAVIVSLVDFAIASGVLAILMVFYGVAPSWKLLFIPFFTALAFVSALGAGLWLAALNVKYRDFRYIVPFIVQVGLYISPVGFSSAVIPAEWRWLYSFNPMVGVIDGFRWCIAENASALYWPGVLLSIILAAVVFGFGFVLFRKMEREFADVI